MEEKRLAAHLTERPSRLKEARAKGVKVIGYFPGNYVPEELIYAAGAIPVCLAEGGNARTAEAALAKVPLVICPFARAQIGERVLKENPYYNSIDMLVAPITCQHLKKVAEIWEYNGDVDIFKLGIPHQHDFDFQVEYFTDRLKALKDRLQSVTGNEITQQKLGQAIELYNRMRGLLRQISLLRRMNPSPFSALDFVKLNHASYYADPVFMVEMLDSVYQELLQKREAPRSGAPRLLLMGPNLGIGDYSVLELAEASGGEVVIEELCEGTRYYWNDIANTGDLLQSLARGYLVDRIPCAFMRNSTRQRLDFTLKLVRDFNINGVIWYQLLCCETYDSESYFMAHKLSELKIPTLILESDYSTSVTGQLKTRIEAFMEILNGEN